MHKGHSVIKIALQFHRSPRDQWNSILFITDYGFLCRRAIAQMSRSKDEIQHGLQARQPTSPWAYASVVIIILFSLSPSLFSHPPPSCSTSCQHLITTKGKTGCTPTASEKRVERMDRLWKQTDAHRTSYLLTLSIFSFAAVVHFSLLLSVKM